MYKISLLTHRLYFFTIFTICNSLGIHHTIVQRYHPGYFMADAIQYPRILYILRCVLKLKRLVGAEKTYDLDIFHASG